MQPSTNQEATRLKLSVVPRVKTIFERPPLKFEAGTPDYIATHGLATALDYVTSLGMDNILAHEQDLTRYALQQLREIEGMHIYGHRNDSGDAVISFNVGDIHHMDLGTMMTCTDSNT